MEESVSNDPSYASVTILELEMLTLEHAKLKHSGVLLRVSSYYYTSREDS